MSRRNLHLILASLAIGLLMASRAERNPRARHVTRGFELIDELALGQPPDEELVAGAVRGMIGVLRRRGDEHSAYVGPDRAQPFRDEMRQQFGGVGVMIRVVTDGPGGLLVAQPPEPGAPAHRAGVRDGDRIVAIDGEPTDGITINEALEQLRGAVGAEVNLRIARRGDGEGQGNAYDELDIPVTRQVIRVPTVRGDRRRADGGWEFRLEEHPEIAHVRVGLFGNRTVEGLLERFETLQAEGVTGVVLDLRNNDGGALDAAIAVTDLFLPEGAPIASTRGRGGEVLDVYVAERPPRFDGVSLVVLIDRDTASAAEIVAAALADNGRATLVGERTFGKGTVQQLLPLEAGRSLLKLTTSSYWRPSGVNIHRWPGAADDEDWGVSPEGANTVTLSDQQLESLREWRRRRDLLPVDDDAPEDASPLAPDRALARAVELLTAGADAPGADASDADRDAAG